MSEQGYRRAFSVSVVVCILLAAALGFVVLRKVRDKATSEEANPVVARGPAAGNQAAAGEDGAAEGLRSTSRQFNCRRKDCKPSA